MEEMNIYKRKIMSQDTVLARDRSNDSSAGTCSIYDADKRSRCSSYAAKPTSIELSIHLGLHLLRQLLQGSIGQQRARQMACPQCERQRSIPCC